MATTMPTTGMPTTGMPRPRPTTGRPRPTDGAGAGAGASLEVEYVADDVTLRLTPDPDDVHAAARLLCAAVQHVRRRQARRVHTAFDLTGPSGGALVAALQDRVGIDVEQIVMRRAGSSVMVTADLLPTPVDGAAPRPVPARPGLGGRPRHHDPRTHDPRGQGPYGHDPRAASSPRRHAGPTRP